MQKQKARIDTMPCGPMHDKIRLCFASPGYARQARMTGYVGQDFSHMDAHGC